MTLADQKIRAFEGDVLIPALTEVSNSSALFAEYEAEIVVQRPSADAAAEQLLASLAEAIQRRAGPSLVLRNRQVPPGLSPLAGRYVMTVFYQEEEDQVYVSPSVIFWMRFNNKLHVFNHRYDNNAARQRVKDVKRSHVLNHILSSFDFYKIYALSELPFPSYRGHDDAQAHMDRAASFSSAGDLDAAIREYREALRLRPQYAELHYNLGNALYDRGDLDEATTQYGEALHLKPDYPEAHYNLAQVFGDKGDVDKAIGHYLEAIHLKPDFPEAHYNLGLQLDAKGALDLAIAEYREAVRLQPHHAEAHHNLGAALYSKGDVGTAIAEIREALRLKPDLAVAHYGLGMALELKGDKVDALVEYLAARRLQPEQPGFSDKYERLLRKIKQ